MDDCEALIGAINTQLRGIIDLKGSVDRVEVITTYDIKQLRKDIARIEGILGKPCVSADLLNRVLNEIEARVKGMPPIAVIQSKDIEICDVEKAINAIKAWCMAQKLKGTLSEKLPSLVTIKI